MLLKYNLNLNKLSFKLKNIKISLYGLKNNSDLLIFYNFKQSSLKITLHS